MATTPVANGKLHPELQQLVLRRQQEQQQRQQQQQGQQRQQGDEENDGIELVVPTRNFPLLVSFLGWQDTVVPERQQDDVNNAVAIEHNDPQERELVNAVVSWFDYAHNLLRVNAFD